MIEFVFACWLFGAFIAMANYYIRLARDWKRLRNDRALRVWLILVIPFASLVWPVFLVWAVIDP